MGFAGARTQPYLLVTLHAVLSSATAAQIARSPALGMMRFGTTLTIANATTNHEHNGL